MQVKIPKNIQREINKKGFYIYEYLNKDEIENLIVYYNSKFFNALIPKVIFILFFIVSFCIFSIFLIKFIPKILLASFLFTCFLTFISSIIIGFLLANKINSHKKIFIGKSKFLYKNKIHIIKNNSISINEKIIGKNLFGKIYKKEINFELNGFSDKVYAKIRNKTLKEVFGYLKNIIYYFGVIFIYINIIFIAVINKITTHIIIKVTLKIYGVIKYKLFNINQTLQKIEEASDKLFYYKLQTGKVIKQRKIGKIKGIITLINKNIKISEKSIKKLKIQLKNNDLQNIFDFETYNIWLKKQIVSPLNSINKLLQKNQISIQKELKNLEKNKTKIDNENLKQNLELAKIRLVLAKNNLTKNIESLENYILKLKI